MATDFQKMAENAMGVHMDWRTVLSTCSRHAASGGVLAVMMALSATDDGADVMTAVLQRMSTSGGEHTPVGEAFIVSSHDAIIMVSAIRSARIAIADNPLVAALMPLADALEQVSLVCANVNSGAMTAEQAHTHLMAQGGYKPTH